MKEQRPLREGKILEANAQGSIYVKFKKKCIHRSKAWNCSYRVPELLGKEMNIHMK